MSEFGGRSLRRLFTFLAFAPDGTLYAIDNLGAAWFHSTTDGWREIDRLPQHALPEARS